jgi:transposase InsO family protein
MDEPLFLIPLFLNKLEHVKALVDLGCECFSAINEKVAKRVGSSFIDIPPRALQQAAGPLHNTRITQMVVVNYDVDGWAARMVAYVVLGLAHDIILGKLWMSREGAILDPQKGILTIRKAGNMVVKECRTRISLLGTSVIMATAINALVQRERRKPGSGGAIFPTSIREMTQVLNEMRETQDSGTANTGPTTVTLPTELKDYKDLFDKTKASGLPPHRGRMDHHIRLHQDQNGEPPELPWGPLYPMSRDQLLELRKQLTELLDKGWIRASSSPAGAPVLLIRKASGGWRLCVDYRGLNKITAPDRYPLPLIKETLRLMSGAKWFTKVDVRAAFHKIRIADGDEPLTAFRTRFGLYEWLVCPFGLTSAPSTFQRYINGALKETLGDFATAYLDDILVHSGGSRQDHIAKVRRVLQLLKEAGLNLDLDKCAFATKEVKYLGFIIEAGKGIRPDPEKLRAVRDWEAPATVRGVRSFLGFANFYRDFVSGFSTVAAPLNRLTGKGVPFRWGTEEQAAFQSLKDAFIAGPVLTQWDPVLETVVETDCSGAALGGCLSQKVDGVLRPVAYHSAALTPEQRNYTIHDKELLAVVRCLEAWSAELRSVHKPFTILTDHKNLEYFTSMRLLSERQSRWAETLSRFSYDLKYRPGKLAARPDALSRREQDQGTGEPQKARVMSPITIATTQITEAPEEDENPQGAQIFADKHMQDLWDEAMKEDPRHRIRLDAVRRNDRRFPADAETAQQIGDCTISAHGTLLWRGVAWLPSWEPLTTTVIQRAHESGLAGHPGKNTTFQILRRDYHWDGMSVDVARYVRNCHCFGAHVQRKKRQGLLQPIPVAARYWSQISMDFMVDLPAKDETAPRYLLVITDRLSKYVQLEAMTSMSAENCAKVFRDTWWRFRGFPNSIITDRGSDWLGGFWTTLCKLVGIEQLLSTAYHPQTDGGTERANQEVQAVLRMMVCFEQTNWPDCLAACQLALNNRDSSVTGVSPNLLLNGYTADLLQKIHVPQENTNTPKGGAAKYLEHLKQGAELAQAAIAFNQQRLQEATNRSRRPAERFQVGDKVWFSMRNVKTNRPSHKLDWLQVKYTVTTVPTPLTVTLDLPGDLHKTVHVDLVERAATDPLPSQRLEDARPGPELAPVDTDPGLHEYGVEEILRVKNARGRKKRKALVKWKGWLDPTWEPLEALQASEALERFEKKWGDARHHDGQIRTRK